MPIRLSGKEIVKALVKNGWQIERVGDHAVDVGEQTAFLITGVFQEFTDASHPVLEQGRDE